jgi:AcrR family transcriptional regulator
MEDRRTQILQAGLALLREEGLPGLTQPRIGARTGLRQSHLTYYYPTRSDLLAAVARSAVEAQAVAAKALVTRIRTLGDASEVIARGTGRHENTRILVALNQAAEREEDVRMLFNELADTFVAEIAALFEKLGLNATPANFDLLHALFVGLSVLDLATCRAEQPARSKAVLDLAFEMFASGRPSKTTVPPRKPRNAEKSGVKK